MIKGIDVLKCYFFNILIYNMCHANVIDNDSNVMENDSLPLDIFLGDVFNQGIKDLLKILKISRY